MSERLVQIAKRTGVIERVKSGETPVIEMCLAEGEYVAGVELNERVLFHSERKTVDWNWTVYVVTPL